MVEINGIHHSVKCACPPKCTKVAVGERGKAGQWGGGRGLGRRAGGGRFVGVVGLGVMGMVMHTGYRMVGQAGM